MIIQLNKITFGLTLFCLSTHISANTINSNKKATAEQIQIYEKEAQLRINNMSLPKGMSVKLWADQSQTQNPAFFSFDSRGRMLMAEISRAQRGAGDIRNIPAMTVPDISIQSNADRLKMYQDFKHVKPMNYYTDYSDQVRLLSDTDNDGRADKSQVFADDFNEPLDGLGSGVIERDGKVYYANIPHLWLLEDENDDGIAEKRTSLQDGFGLRMSFFGHDMHGFVWGPDGKLYWTIGDRGYSFTTKEGKTFHGPNQSSVFRADPDGSNIEVFYTGLRNPTELAFDQFGNLFTADNDGDGGDEERINFLVEGGESGWHAGHQSLMSFTKRLKLRSHIHTGEGDIPSIWMTHDMWKIRNENQPAFMLPAVGQIDAGPSGMTYNPSNNLGDEWKNTFFVAHYRGSPNKTSIAALTVKPDGASFLMDSKKTFIKGMNAVDVDFGPDGNMYVSEFNFSGWDSKDEGAVYRITSESHQNNLQAAANYQHLTSDFDQKQTSELIAFLENDHMQMRQRAQFALAKRPTEALPKLTQLAKKTDAPLLARVHAIWGIGQIADIQNQNQKKNQKKSPVLDALLPLMSDPNAQIRAQTARVLGDNRYMPAAEYMSIQLYDENEYVAMYAALGLSRINYPGAIPHVMARLSTIKDQDLWLRHGLVMALVATPKSFWIDYANHDSEYVRMAILLCLRRLNDPQIAMFLTDKSDAIVEEALIAIHDNNISGAANALASHLDNFIEQNDSDLTSLTGHKVKQLHQHRMINTNYNLGQLAHAERLLKYAQQSLLPDRLAAEALAAIEDWQTVNPIDPITGLPTVANQNRADIKPLVQQYLPRILEVVNGQSMAQAMRLADKNDYTIPSELLFDKANKAINLPLVRVQALDVLYNRNEPSLLNHAVKLTQDAAILVRSKALDLVFKLDQSQGLKIAKVFLDSGKTADQQAALKTLKSEQLRQIDIITIELMQSLLAEEINKGMILELLDLANSRASDDVRALVMQYQANIESAPAAVKYAGTLMGGDVQSGKQLFDGEGQCLRCHRITWKGGKVGPELTAIANYYDAEYFIKAMVEPSADIASGYGTMVITTDTGETVSGTYLSETDKMVELQLNEETKKQFLKSSLTNIQRPVSGMPPMQYMLTEYQMRDIIEYLKTLKVKSKPAPGPDVH